MAGCISDGLPWQGDAMKGGGEGKSSGKKKKKTKTASSGSQRAVGISVCI